MSQAKLIDFNILLIELLKGARTMKEFEMTAELAEQLLDDLAGYLTNEGRRLLEELLSDEKL